MKTIDRPKWSWLLAAAAAAVVGLLAACDEQKSSPTDGGSSQPIKIEDIIAQPKAVGPGDTLILSAIVTSTSQNVGDVPKVVWSAASGAATLPDTLFLENNQSSVRWKAPAGGVYRVTARATNMAGTVTGGAHVFVGQVTRLVTSQAGAIRLRANPTDIYYLRSGGNINTGVEVYGVTGGTVADAVNIPAAVNGPNNKFLAFAPDGSFEVHSMDSLVAGVTTSPVHLYKGDFGTKTLQRISPSVSPTDRYPAFNHPNVAPDSRYIAYGAMFPTPTVLAADTFDIIVHDVVTASRRNVTATHSNHRNAFPTWSTDQRWLTFVSDRHGQNRWDLYGLPVTGGVVNANESAVVRLLNSGGTLMPGTIGAVEFRRPLSAWNPVAPTLAVLASSGVLYLVATTPTGASQIDVGTFASGRPVDLKWSPDGSLLAVSTTAEILTVTPTGARTSLLKRGTDSFFDLAWSPDGAWLVYRARRDDSAWLEVIDMDQSTVAEPLPITAAAPVGAPQFTLASYRALMSMSPAWGATNVIFHPTFATGASTVGIVSVDASSLAP